MNTEQTTLTQDELLSIQSLPFKLILAAANGQIDLNAMARDELISRGLDRSGKWVGFDQACVWEKRRKRGTLPYIIFSFFECIMRR